MTNKPINKTTSTSTGLIITVGLILFLVIGSCILAGIFGVFFSKDQKTQNINIQNTNNASPQSIAAENKNPIINILDLVLKSPNQIENTLGKSQTAKRIIDSDLFDQENEYKLNNSISDSPLIIRFKDAKAVQFILNIESKSGNKVDIDFIKRFGIDVYKLKNEKYPLVSNWTGEQHGINFEKISVMKIDGDNYSHLTLIVNPK